MSVQGCTNSQRRSYWQDVGDRFCDMYIYIYVFKWYLNYSDIFRRFVIYSPRLVCILPCLENESNPGIFGWCLSNPKITPPFRCCFLFLKVATGFSCIIRLTWLLLSAVFIGWWLTSRTIPAQQEREIQIACALGHIALSVVFHQKSMVVDSYHGKWYCYDPCIRKQHFAPTWGGFKQELSIPASKEKRPSQCFTVSLYTRLGGVIFPLKSISSTGYFPAFSTCYYLAYTCIRRMRYVTFVDKFKLCIYILVLKNRWMQPQPLSLLFIYTV